MKKLLLLTTLAISLINTEGYAAQDDLSAKAPQENIEDNLTFSFSYERDESLGKSIESDENLKAKELSSRMLSEDFKTLKGFFTDSSSATTEDAREVHWLSSNNDDLRLSNEIMRKECKDKPSDQYYDLGYNPLPSILKFDNPKIAYLFLENMLGLPKEARDMTITPTRFSKTKVNFREEILYRISIRDVHQLLSTNLLCLYKTTEDSTSLKETIRGIREKAGLNLFFPPLKEHDFDQIKRYGKSLEILEMGLLLKSLFSLFNNVPQYGDQQLTEDNFQERLENVLLSNISCLLNH
jgi:hypothetical protein